MTPRLHPLILVVLLAVLFAASCTAQRNLPPLTATPLPLTVATVVQQSLATMSLVTRTPAPTPTPSANISTTEAPTPTTPPVMGEVFLDSNAAEVNVRAGPATTYTIVGTLPNKQVVQVTGRSPHGEWLQINANGLVGWVYALYMVVKDNAQAIPCIGSSLECSGQPPQGANSQPASTSLVVEPGQPVTVNGILMRLEKVDMTANYTTLTLCYEKPTHQGNSDWMLPRGATLQAGPRLEMLEQYGLLADPEVGLANARFIPPPGGRCVSMGLPLGHAHQPGPLTLTLTVPYLEKSQPEVIPDADIQAANARLKLEGIEMSYQTFQAVGGGGGGPVIVRKPEGMSDTDVLAKFFAALGYYYTGPWVFNLTVQVPDSATRSTNTP